MFQTASHVVITPIIGKPVLMHRNEIKTIQEVETPPDYKDKYGVEEEQLTMMILQDTYQAPVLDSTGADTGVTETKNMFFFIQESFDVMTKKLS